MISCFTLTFYSFPFRGRTLNIHCTGVGVDCRTDLEKRAGSQPPVYARNLIMISPGCCQSLAVAHTTLDESLWKNLFFKYGIPDLFVLSSPRSGTSSNASTPSTKKLDGEKPTTPISKSVTPTSGGSGSSTAAGASGLKPVVCEISGF
jgi:hypothetical protein